MELTKALEPKNLDNISIKTNSSLYYINSKTKHQENRRNRQKSGSQSFQNSNLDLSKENLKKFIDKDIYKVNRSNFKKDTLLKRDKSYIVQFQHKQDKDDCKSITESKKQGRFSSVNKSISEQKEEKLQVSEPESKNKLKSFIQQRDNQISESLQKYNELNKFSKSKEKIHLPRNLSLNDLKKDDTSLSPSKNNLQSIHQKILSIIENHKDSLKGLNQENNLEHIISKKDFQALVQNYPNLDTNNLDAQNLDYLAHILNLCECYKCECNACRCPYACNNEKPRYNFHDLTTTNQAVNHKVQTAKLKAEIDPRVDYDNKFVKEEDITKNTSYQKDFKSPVKLMKDLENRNVVFPPAPHVFRSTYQSAYPVFYHNTRDKLINLQQFRAQKSPFMAKSLYQDSFTFKDYKPEPSQPIPFKIDNRSQPFVYKTAYSGTYQGFFNQKARPYLQRHSVQTSDQLPNFYQSNYEKMGQDLRLGAEKSCPKKIHQNKHLLKQQIIDYLQK